MIYLDYNATAPLRAPALAAMTPWFGVPANPSAAHAGGQAAAMAVDRARTQVAGLLGWPRDRIVFTSGASESNATVLSRGRWVASAVDHPSVRQWCVAELPVDGQGVVSLDALAAVEGVDGVSVMLANNETGVVQPIREVIRIARARGWKVHVDAAQAPGRVSLADLAGADFVTLASHKIGGPQGMGALAVPPGDPSPHIRGAAQERGWRAGTHNVAGIVGFGAIAEQVAKEGLLSPARRDRLEAGLVALGGEVASVRAPRLPQTACVAFADRLAPDVVMALDLAGIQASAGSACSSGAARPSAVLAAMGFAGSGIRFSMGIETTDAEIDATIAAVARVLGR